MNALLPPLDPRIGLLADGRCYAFVHGYHRPETIGTRTEVERALGLAPPAPKAQAKGKMRRYTVTVTPQTVVFTGTHIGGAYSVEVVATSRVEAIKKVRQLRWKEDGRFTVPAQYRARIKGNTDAETD